MDLKETQQFRVKQKVRLSIRKCQGGIGGTKPLLYMEIEFNGRGLVVAARARCGREDREAGDSDVLGDLRGRYKGVTRALRAVHPTPKPGLQGFRVYRRTPWQARGLLGKL